MVPKSRFACKRSLSEYLIYDPARDTERLFIEQLFYPGKVYDDTRLAFETLLDGRPYALEKLVPAHDNAPPDGQVDVRASRDKTGRSLVLLTIAEAEGDDGQLRPEVVDWLNSQGFGGNLHVEACLQPFVGLDEPEPPSDARVWMLHTFAYLPTGDFELDGLKLNLSNEAVNVSADAFVEGSIAIVADEQLAALCRRAGLPTPYGPSSAVYRVAAVCDKAGDIDTDIYERRCWRIESPPDANGRYEVRRLSGDELLPALEQGLDPRSRIYFEPDREAEQDDGSAFVWRVVVQRTRDRRGESVDRFYLSKIRSGLWLEQYPHWLSGQGSARIVRPDEPIEAIEYDLDKADAFESTAWRAAGAPPELIRQQDAFAAAEAEQSAREDLARQAPKLPTIVEHLAARGQGGNASADLVENWVTADGRAVLLGPPKAGKTTLLLQLALSVAAGRDDFLGWRVHRHGPVVYLTTEQRTEAIYKAARAVANGMGLDLDYYVSLGLITIMSTIDGPDGVPRHFYDQPARDALGAIVAKQGAVLAIYDTIGEGLIEGDARQYTAMRNALMSLDASLARAGALSLVATHPVKQSQGKRRIDPRDCHGSGLYEYSKSFITMGARHRGRSIIATEANACAPQRDVAVEFAYEGGSVATSRVADARGVAAEAKAEDAIDDLLGVSCQPEVDWAAAPKHAQQIYELVSSKPGERFSTWSLYEALKTGRSNDYGPAVEWLLEQNLVRKSPPLPGEKKSLRITS